jgi:hypothetical protein
MLACIGLAIEEEMCFKLMLSCGKTTNQMRLLLKMALSLLLPQDSFPIVMSSCVLSNSLAISWCNCGGLMWPRTIFITLVGTVALDFWLYVLAHGFGIYSVKIWEV